ncbi:MAG: response regulator [Lachnospiraceae bacterium]|nr:response regulator [Lachnospiraceae bacterium]
MLRIFLVEDEYVVREGIKKIDWESHGFEFCGEAPDGEMALPLIRKSEPDIVITDIKMPFMDGLELTRLVKKELPYTEIIILSGYEEFSYAKEAISLGVAKYLTKPVSAQELIAELNGLKDDLEQKKSDRENAIKYQSDMEEDILKERKDFFNELVGGNVAVSEIIERSEALGLDLRASVYCILLVTTYIQSDLSDVREEAGSELYQSLHEWSSKSTDSFILFNRDVDGQAILFGGDNEKELKETIEKCTDEFIEIVSTFKDVRYYAGVGCIVERLSELNRSYEAAGAAFAHRYFDTSNRVVYWQDNSLLIYGEQELDDDDVISSADVKNLDRARLIDFLKTGDISEKDYFIEELLNNTGIDALRSSMFRQYVAMDLYFTAVDFCMGLGYEKDDIPSPDVSQGTLLDVEALKSYCREVISKSIELRDSISKSRYKDVVDKVIGYIEEHYMDEELSLNTLAEYVRFSPNHLSTIFSQETGETFSKYLIEYRIGKAKEELKCTSKKSSEIAIDTGYKDPHYFSYMFKKITGLTPTQYREGK